MSAANRHILRRILPHLVALLCFFALAAAICWAILVRGIEINHISLPAADLHRLFLQVDQGLIIRVGRIVVDEDSAAGQGPGLESHIPLVKKWGHLIREIDVHRFIYRDHYFSIAYRQGSFRILGDIFTCHASVSYEQGTYRIDIESLQFRPLDLAVAGKAQYRRTDNHLQFTGSFALPEAAGTMRINSLDQDIDASLTSDHFEDLPAVLARFPVDREVIDWVRDNISGRDYRVTMLRLQCRLEELRSLEPRHISGSAVAASAAVRFHPDLPPIECDRVDVTYLDDRLSFLLENPKYTTKNLQGSDVYIEDLTGDQTRLIINLKAKSRIDKNIRERV